MGLDFILNCEYNYDGKIIRNCERMALLIRIYQIITRLQL